MGRISKRHSSLKQSEKQQRVDSYEKKRYKAGIYARLSSNQDGKYDSRVAKNESIDMQIEIAKKFVEDFNGKQNEETIEVMDCYTDLGKTGSNFEREGFLRLMQDIRLGEINCVIVKDLSRFGRNYLEAGNYIEKIFPFLGVRFIAVSDGFDTGKAGNENKQIASEIKNLVNDMYAKDFSKKAKIQLKQRREEGSYVGGPSPYGYIAGWKEKKRILIPDENTAEIVRFIYEKFVETESCTAVADELNRRKINPPVIYKKTREVYYPSGQTEYKGWDKSSVERIVSSATYIGTLVQGKTTLTGRSEKNRIHKPEAEWVVTEHAHEPLIEVEMYQKAAEVLQKIKQKSASRRHPTEGCPVGENIFDNLLYCGVCGRKMTRSSYVKHYADGTKARLDGYFCLNGGQTKVTVCPDSNRISKTELMDILIPLIRMEFAVFLEKPQKYMKYGKERIAEAEKKAEMALKNAENGMSKFQEEESRIYMDYCEGSISQKEYVDYKLKQEEKQAELRKKIEEQKREIEALEKLSVKYLSAVKALLKLKSGKELTKEMIEIFISKIYVYPGKRVEVLFDFTSDGIGGF